ncbi:hypothetical protein [Mesorhizobium silamurunense]|uniref:hypothetical protein n=1 Tax=Mesorhizobium silamurunense TaxID=499528 RepID=UPI001784F6D0|nr:hypothetical protein [Mesorhizobium silamurunense]
MLKTGPGWEQAYEPLEFAQKHGLTLKQAEIVIHTNGPSKHKCDLAAPIFLKALKELAKNRENRSPARGRLSADL